MALTACEEAELLRLLEIEAEGNILTWLDGKKTEKGEPITLVDHEFQKDLWEDFSPVIAVRKAAQIGISTVFILKCVFLLEKFGYNIIYTLPTLQNDVRKFVPSKVDPLLEKNGFKFSRDSMTLKRIGKGFWHFGGTHGEKEGISTQADVVLHDEIDRSNLDVIGTYKSRLGHSQYARRWFFSNPSAPKRGADEWWLKSDQKHWFLKCECGKGNFGGWQYLNWPENVDYAQQRYVCVHCRREITDDMRRNGQWVAKYPSKEISGYWMSQMIAPWIPCSSLIEDEQNESQQYFYNFVLGIPHIGADVVVNRELILRNIREGTPNTANTFMGIDVGQQLHVVIGNLDGIFKIAACDWRSVNSLIDLYQPRQIVIDALPETTKAKELRDAHPRRVKLCYYLPPTNRPPKSQDVFEVDLDEQTVSAYRTEVVDRVIKDFSDGKIDVFIPAKEPLLVGTGKKGESYSEHWESLYLMHDEEKNIYTWEHSGPDHFVHATVYYWLAKQVGGSLKKHEVRVN